MSEIKHVYRDCVSTSVCGVTLLQPSECFPIAEVMANLAFVREWWQVCARCMRTIQKEQQKGQTMLLKAAQKEVRVIPTAKTVHSVQQELLNVPSEAVVVCYDDKVGEWCPITHVQLWRVSEILGPLYRLQYDDDHPVVSLE